MSASLTGVLFVSSLFTTGYVSWSNDHIPNSEDPFTQFDKVYEKPWTRLGPYLVGMLTGWILFKTNLKIRMTRVSNYFDNPGSIVGGRYFAFVLIEGDAIKHACLEVTLI